MLDLILAGGWLMVPLLICSILALAIIIERSYALRYNKIIPNGLVNSVINDFNNQNITNSKTVAIKSSSPLGNLLVLILKNISADRQVIISLLENAGSKIMHNLEKHLNMLGTIATISPLLGLLGTVIGMIDVFSVITTQGVGNPNTLAGGISQALITTAVGLTVAIPSLIYYRSFQRRLDELSYQLEHQSMNFLDILKNNSLKIHAAANSSKENQTAEETV